MYNIVKSFLWIGIFYFFIFQPPIIPKTYYLSGQMALVLIYACLHFRVYSRFFTRFRGEFILLSLIVIYTLLIDAVGGAVVYSDRFIGWFFQAFIVSGALLSIYKVKYRSENDFEIFLPEIYLAILLAAILTCLLYAYRPFDLWYESIQLDSYYERYSSFDVRYRAYGISENLTFTYSMVLGLCAGYSLLLIRKSWFYLMLIPFFIFGMSVNARIGFLSFIFLAIYLFFSGFRYKIFLLVLISVLFFWFSMNASWLLRDYEWNFGFFTDILDFLVNGLDGNNTISSLLNNHIVLPETLSDLLFGTGASVYAGGGVLHSDIGYIIQLNYGGVTLLFMLALIVLYMSLRLFKVLGGSHWLSWFFPFSILSLNFKGFIFAMTPGGRLLVLLYIFFIARELVNRPYRETYNNTELFSVPHKLSVYRSSAKVG